MVLWISGLLAKAVHDMCGGGKVGISNAEAYDVDALRSFLLYDAVYLGEEVRRQVPYTLRYIQVVQYLYLALPLPFFLS
jgi:hypothetical protein